MKYAFIERFRHEFAVRRMCAVFDVSPSGFYAWRKRPTCRARGEDRRLTLEIRSIFRESRETYGSPRVLLELRRGGIRCSRKRIVRLMRREGLRPKKARLFRRTTKSTAGHVKAANVLDRGFSPAAPDRAWAGDITYLRTSEGWLYLAVLIDLYSRRVVGWATSTRLTRDLAVAALDRAFGERRTGAGLIHHSDRGCQYTSDDYQRRLLEKHMIASMSRQGNCWDNAVAESFFATLKTELGDRFDTRESAQLELIDYIEVFYNRKRLHSAVGYLSPVEAESRFETRAAA